MVHADLHTWRKNVIGIGACNSYSGIWFFNGVFLKDKQKKLINAQEGEQKLYDNGVSVRLMKLNRS